MVFFNYALRKLNAKIVYYGPGLCGKTTNLQWIHDHFEGGQRGKMISLATEGDRTIFFDLLPLEIGTIRGMEVTLQLYTVPGQVHYNSTRQLVLKGADGVVFVADSQRAMASSNRESLENLRENLSLQGIDLTSFPHVLQFNKRDLRDLMSIEELNSDLNPGSVPIFEGVATDGIGVQETLEGIVKLVMRSLRERYEPTGVGRTLGTPVGPRPGPRPAPPPSVPLRPPQPATPEVHRPAMSPAPDRPVQPASPVAPVRPPQTAQPVRPPQPAPGPSSSRPGAAPAGQPGPGEKAAAADTADVLQPPRRWAPAPGAGGPPHPSDREITADLGSSDGGWRDSPLAAGESPFAGSEPLADEDTFGSDLEHEARAVGGVAKDMVAELLGSDALAAQTAEEDFEVLEVLDEPLQRTGDQALPEARVELRREDEDAPPQRPVMVGFEAAEHQIDRIRATSPFVRPDQTGDFGPPAAPDLEAAAEPVQRPAEMSWAADAFAAASIDTEDEVVQPSPGLGLEAPAEAAAFEPAVAADSSLFEAEPTPFEEVLEHVGEPRTDDVAPVSVAETDTDLFEAEPEPAAARLSPFDELEAEVRRAGPRVPPSTAPISPQDLTLARAIAGDPAAQERLAARAQYRREEALVFGEGDPFASEPEPTSPPVEVVLGPAADERSAMVSVGGDNQLRLQLHGTGALAEYGQVRELDLKVPVPGAWIGNRRVTLQLRLTLEPAPEDEHDGTA